MANQKDIKRKIKAVHNIKKVTKAMEAISNIRLQKAMKMVFSSRDYSRELLSFVAQILKTLGPDGRTSSDLMRSKPVKNMLFVVLSSDKGLCGVYNSKLFMHVHKAADEEKSKGVNVSMITAGKKAFDFFKRRDYKILNNYGPSSSDSKMELARNITGECVIYFESGAVDNVYIFYNHFVSIAKQEVSAIKFLPVVLELEEAPPHFPLRILGLFEEGEKFNFPEFIFESDKKSIITMLLKRYLETIMQQSLFEANSSEHAARLVAMQQSIINADEMILSLSMLYNKVRQSLITREIIEIISSAEALS